MSDYFYGYYFKMQSETGTAALIAAEHGTGKDKSCSLQVINETGAWVAKFPYAMYSKKGKHIWIGENSFSKDGVTVDVKTDDLTVQGSLKFGTLTPLNYDIMGPFALVPYMECRHMVMSMKHTVTGTLRINEKEYHFLNDNGYWEGDTGRSFPKEYLWTQTFLPEGGSLMLSVADIPFPGFSFTGIIGVVYWHGKEYRIATYLGARANSIANGEACIIQGNKILKVKLTRPAGMALRAPVKGNMVRTIHESAECGAEYEFWIKDRKLFHYSTERATFEYEYK